MPHSRRAKMFLAIGKVLSQPRMRPLTRTFTNLHALAYRATNGRAQSATYPTLLLTVTGRKTGKARTVPLVYVRNQRPDQFVIAAAYSGSDSQPTWWLNLRADPCATVRVDGDTYFVRAEAVTGTERAQLWTQLVRMYPYFTDYQRRTTREIPVITLTPDQEPQTTSP